METMDPSKTTRRKKAKKGLILFLVVLVVALGLYGYFWLKGLNERDQRAQDTLGENVSLRVQEAEYKQLLDEMSGEFEDCKEFLLQDSGDFSRFEYCKQFIEWKSTVELRLSELRALPAE